MKRMLVCLSLLLFATANVTAEENPTNRIAWHGSLKKGLALAKKTNRPIFLVSGAPSCLGVPGVW